MRAPLARGSIEIGECRFGRGVFATADIPSGSIVEEAPVLVVAEEFVPQFNSLFAELGYHVFAWGEGRDQRAIPMGYGYYYNHSTAPNVEFTPDRDGIALTFTAIEDIVAGEELVIDYKWGVGGEPLPLPWTSPGPAETARPS